MVKLQGVASQARPLDVRTDAFGGTVFTEKTSWVPRVTVAHPEVVAPMASNATVTDAREIARFIS
jgi:hypothetical protein